MNKIELKCEICSHKFDSDYNIPKVLSCGHTVCSKCVERMKDKSLNRCPFDRKILDFEDDQVAINYYILSLIDASIKDSHTLQISPDEDEEFTLSPRPVINSPGWKNTMDGFIKNDILYTVESNGFIYCTDLNTGEWWFMYHNQFFGNFIFQNPSDGKMYIIDQSGSLFQIFNKNYYVQIGKKNGWRNTTHKTVFNNKMFSMESSNKFYETNLQNGKWREIVISKTKQREFIYNSNSINSFNKFFSKSAGNERFRIEEDETEGKLFKSITMLISTDRFILFANKNGELYSYNEHTGEAKLVTNEFQKNVEDYSANSSHVYYFEKNMKVVYRTVINVTEEDEKVIRGESSNVELLEKSEVELKKFQEVPLTTTINKAISISKSKSKSNLFLQTEIFLNFDTDIIPSIIPSKLITDDKRLVIIDKIGDLYIFDLKTKKLINNFQCLFMLRNCHLSNTALIGDGDLLLLDPIRQSLNKLNILAGTEVIVLNSTKFLYSIKHIFSANSRIYFIDVQGNLYYFNEFDKKLTQIGNSSICKYIVDFAVYKNYLLTIENSHTLYKTNLNDGNYIEVKNDLCKNYEFFFADNAHIIFINKEDEISVAYLNNNTPSSSSKAAISFEGNYKDVLKIKKSFKFDHISKMSALTYFRNHLVFYNKDKKTIETVNVEDVSHRKMADNFPDVNMFINNNDFLACISRDGVIYKLYC